MTQKSAPPKESPREALERSQAELQDKQANIRSVHRPATVDSHVDGVDGRVEVRSVGGRVFVKADGEVEFDQTGALNLSGLIRQAYMSVT